MAQSTRKFVPSLAILALAGSAEALTEAAIADLSRGVLSFVQHGTRNVLSDTREALQTLSGAKARRVLAMVDSAYTAADVHFAQHKRQAAEPAEAAAKAIVEKAIAEFDAAEAAAETARKAKAAESKAKAEAAKATAARALKAAAKAVEPKAAALTVASAIDVLRAACAAGDASAQAGVLELVAIFADVTETAAA